MNKNDRKALADAQTKLALAISTTEDCAATLRTLADDERAKFDNMTEGLQQSELGQAIERAADALSEAADAAEGGNAQEAADALENIE